jgi:hypothetical protein
MSFLFRGRRLLLKQKQSVEAWQLENNQGAVSAMQLLG